MIDHLSTYATDFDATQKFYDAALAALGAKRVLNMTAHWEPDWPTRRMCAYGRDGTRTLWVVETKETHTPRHVAFAAADEEAVRGFYSAGLAAGGRDNGEPGPRALYHPGYFGCFLIDPDGNNVEAVFHAHKP